MNEPESHKVLCISYAYTESTIASINSIGLDYYLMKHWDPPERILYLALDDLLSDWQATVPLPYEGIRIAGTLWSPTCHRVQEFLACNWIPYQWLDIEKDADAAALAAAASPKRHRLPVVLFHLLTTQCLSSAGKVMCCRHSPYGAQQGSISSCRLLVRLLCPLPSASIT